MANYVVACAPDVRHGIVCRLSVVSCEGHCPPFGHGQVRLAIGLNPIDEVYEVFVWMVSWKRLIDKTNCLASNGQEQLVFAVRRK